MKTDLISRSELFNKLATVPIKAESVETTTEIFKIINSMPVESVGIAESVVEQICDKYCKFPHIVESDNELDRICDNCPLDKLALDLIEPGSDLISRQDAISVLIRWLSGEELGADIIDLINSLPSTEAVKVAYICDGRACDSDCSECFRTTNIKHAKNFIRLGGAYMEQPEAVQGEWVKEDEANCGAKMNKGGDSK